MALQKELVCMHCKKALPFGQGFKHDEDLNFICSHCNKPIFGVTEAAEEVCKKAQPSTPTSTTMGFCSGFNKKEPLPIKVGSVEPVTQMDDATGEEYACFV